MGVPWLIVVTPRWLVRGASIGFFQALLVLYILAIPSFVLGSVISLAVVRVRCGRVTGRVEPRGSMGAAVSQRSPGPGTDGGRLGHHTAAQVTPCRAAHPVCEQHFTKRSSTTGP